MTSRHHPRRRGHRPISAVLLGLALVACSGGGDGDGDARPVATFGTLPVTEPSATEPSDAEASDPPSSAETGDAVSTTVPLTAAPGMDRPTGSPEDIATGAPGTTVPGPLPIPSVQLVEIGTFGPLVEITSRPIDNRQIVVEQSGRVLAVDDLSQEVLIDLSAFTSAGGEQGLLGVAFDPVDDLAYVHHTDTDGDTVVAEYAVDPISGVFDPDTRRVVLTVEQPFGNHNGGELAFGPDRMLYLGLGDGGSADDPLRASLDLGSRLGKILRIDPTPDGDQPFTVPDDNPFVDVDGADPTIWSLGLRNPWKFSFDGVTGDLWIADVGQNRFEEINLAPATDEFDAGRGLSFGWSAFEGDARFHDDQSPDGHIPPVYTYPHEDGACSVSGGAVYRGDLVPDLFGWYVFGDFCSGRIWGLDTTSVPGDPVVVELATLPNLTAIGIGAGGDVFAVSGNGTLARLDIG